MVAAGLTLVEPLAEVEVNVPGVIATLVAPVVVQARAALAPALMPVGFAKKDAMFGIDCDPFPPDPVDAPQPASHQQASSAAGTIAPFKMYFL